MGHELLLDGWIVHDRVLRHRFELPTRVLMPAAYAPLDIEMRSGCLLLESAAVVMERNNTEEGSASSSCQVTRVLEWRRTVWGTCFVTRDKAAENHDSDTRTC